MPRFLRELRDLGFTGVQNFPTVGVIDGNFRQVLEETGMSFKLEVEMIRAAHELDLLTTPYAFDPQEARWLADAGADIVVAHMNTTTKGMIGVTSAPTLDEAVERVQAIADAAIEVNPDVLVLCHGGPIAEPEDAQYVLDRTTGVVGLLRRLEHGAATGRDSDRRERATIQGAVTRTSLTSRRIRPDSRGDSASHSVTMITEFDDEDLAAADALRERQEREIALGHSLTTAEHELAREAFTLGRTFERAGIDFDPLTFVALRIVEGSHDEHVDRSTASTCSWRSASSSGRSRWRSTCSRTAGLNRRHRSARRPRRGTCCRRLPSASQHERLPHDRRARGGAPGGGLPARPRALDGAVPLARAREAAAARGRGGRRQDRGGEVARDGDAARA